MSLTLDGGTGNITGLNVETGNLPAGSILQVVSTTKTDVFTVSVPGGASSSAVTGLTATITPSSTSNKILVMLSLSGSNDVAGHLAFSFLRDGSIISGTTGSSPGSRTAATSSSYNGTTDTASMAHINGIYLDSPGSTSSLTYGVSLVNVFGVTRVMAVNRTEDDNNDAFRARTVSTITVMEVAA